MFAVGRIALSIVCLGLLSGVASAATPKKPADHHGYRWGPQSLLCTSVLAERRENDKVVVTYNRKRYWCSRPTMSRELASEATGLAIAKRFDPAATHRWQIALPSCTGSAGDYVCQVNVPQLQARAAVTWSASGPRVVFTSFVCGEQYAGMKGC